jgi:type I restriction-modification system DNA methylase subunit
MTNGNGSQQIVNKLWSYCHVLRDDGLSYLDYIEQLTFLVFLKMADERTKPPYNQPSIIPNGWDWQSLVVRDGDALEIQYRHILEELAKEPGMLGVIFRKAQNKIQDPAKLRRLVVDLIDKEQWTMLDVDVKGDAYEGLRAERDSTSRLALLSGPLSTVFAPSPGRPSATRPAARAVSFLQRTNTSLTTIRAWTQINGAI